LSFLCVLIDELVLLKGRLENKSLFIFKIFKLVPKLSEFILKRVVTYVIFFIEVLVPIVEVVTFVTVVMVVLHHHLIR
jgi:hypothetical protein